MLSAVLVWMLACLAFWYSLRKCSLALLLLGMPLAMQLGMPFVREVMADSNPAARALTREFLQRGITSADDLYWAEGRPNETIEFYSGLRIRRIVDEIELAEVREGRKAASAELQQKIGELIAQRFEQERPGYVIMTRKYYDRLAQSGVIAHKVFFRLDGYFSDTEDDLVVFTQPGQATDLPSAPQNQGDPDSAPADSES